VGRITLTVFVFGIAPADVQAKTTFVTIGTGGITGVYYPTGGAIAKMVNAKRKEYGIRATVESTGGSVFNINAMMSGDLEFGVAQSDRQYQAIKGMAEWDGKPQKDLRAVFSIHPESVTLLATVDSGINDHQGPQRANASISATSGIRTAPELPLTPWKPMGSIGRRISRLNRSKAAEAPGLLQDGRIDAFFYTVGHPSGAYKEATAGATKVRFVVHSQCRQTHRKVSLLCCILHP
jgi:TRAP-type uncharacterized transport system substrate-binding protein